MYKRSDIFKLVFLGDYGAGRTALATRLERNIFTNDEITIGVEFVNHILDFHLFGDLINIKLQIWEANGSERYRPITKSFYRGALGALLVYDLSNARSFQYLKHWVDEIRLYGRRNTVIFLVGAKMDLKQAIPDKEIVDFAKRNKLIYVRTSAKTGENVQFCFEHMAKMVYFRRKWLGDVTVIRRLIEYRSQQGDERRKEIEAIKQQQFVKKIKIMKLQHNLRELIHLIEIECQ